MTGSLSDWIEDGEKDALVALSVKVEGSRGPPKDAGAAAGVIADAERELVHGLKGMKHRLKRI